MKTERNILIAFFLNFTFSIFEFIGGIFTGSVAITSDALHDIGDAFSIGISYFCERKSRKKPNEKYTYGYIRYSVIGSLITTLILIVGSIMIIYNAVNRILFPAKIHCNGMLIFAIVGVLVNFCAVLFTRDGKSLNEKSVNLHMLEDVLGWLVVLLGAIVIRFTGFVLIDPIMSIGVAVFILVHSIKNAIEIFAIFLEKTPQEVDISKIKEHICQIDGVIGVHHIHIWTLNEQNTLATLHVVTDDNACKIKRLVRDELAEHNIIHATIEIEKSKECCLQPNCSLEIHTHSSYHHH